MTPYEPTSRRPIAQMFRATAAWSVRICLRYGIHPDTISYFSLVAAAVAGLCYWRSESYPLLLAVGSLACGVRLWMNMLDGMVALASGKASLRGEIVNELPDRFSDVLIFAGVAHSGLCHMASGYWAAIMALLTAYVGTLGQAVARRRQFGGCMSKPWRMAVLIAGSVITLVLDGRGGPPARAWGLSILDWTCLIIVLGCAQTIAVRLARTLRDLQSDEHR